MDPSTEPGYQDSPTINDARVMQHIDVTSGAASPMQPAGERDFTVSSAALTEPAVNDAGPTTLPNQSDVEPVSSPDPVVPTVVMGGSDSPSEENSGSTPTASLPVSPPIVGGAPASPSSSSDGEYTSNPFMNVVKGLTLTLTTNPGPALLSGFFGILAVGIGYLLFIILAASAGAAGAIIMAIVLAISYMTVLGTFYAIGGSSAKGEKVTTGEAFSKGLRKLFPLLALTILTAIITVVGFVLLVVPGMILAARLLLGPIVMFEEGLGPIKSMKRSWSLTKGHVNEMLGAAFAGAFIGETYFSLLFGAISVSPAVGRYHDLVELEKSGGSKPKVHWLNYLYIVDIALLVGTIAFVTIVLANDLKNASNNTVNNSNSSQNFNFNYNFNSQGSTTNTQ